MKISLNKHLTKCHRSTNAQVRFKEFVDYVNEFYNIDTGIYKIATRKRLQLACVQYVQKMTREGREAEVEYDSLDREGVRQILQPSYSFI